MESSSVKVNNRHQITIPEWARKQLNIKSGDHVLVDVQHEMMLLLPLHKGYTETLAGLHCEIWNGADQHILQERNVWIVPTDQER